MTEFRVTALVERYPFDCPNLWLCNAYAEAGENGTTVHEVMKSWGAYIEMLHGGYWIKLFGV